MGDGLLVCEDHLLDLIWSWEPGLASRFADDVLAPLGDLGTKQGRVLSDTLFAWLAHQGRVPEVAAVLHAHPQTVRYRMRGLRQLLGDRLDDPLARFRLETALRYRLGAPEDPPD